MSRRAAREIVLHLIFSADYLQCDADYLLKDRVNEQEFQSLAEDCPVYENMPEESQSEYIDQAVRGVLSHSVELDSYIEKYAVGWNVGRISRISKCILRLCMYEVLYMGIPVGASVNEALELAKSYDGETAANFVNGIMGSFVEKEVKRG